MNAFEKLRSWLRRGREDKVPYQQVPVVCAWCGSPCEEGSSCWLTSDLDGTPRMLHPACQRAIQREVAKAEHDLHVNAAKIEQQGPQGTPSGRPKPRFRS